jgi:hypothetical protein
VRSPDAGRPAPHSAAVVVDVTPQAAAHVRG